MSGKINFAGVEEARDTRMTPPGTIDVFEIKAVEFNSTKTKGTYYCGVTFDRKIDQFNHSFFLSEKAIGRLKSLIKHASGKLLDEEISEEQIIKMLVGRQVAMKVIPKFDDESGRVYPDLPFGGFCKSPDKIDELAFNDKEKSEIKRASEIIAKSSSSRADGAKPEPKDDLEGSGAVRTSAPLGKADDDIF